MMIDAENIRDLTDESLELGVVAGISEFIAEQTRRELSKP